MKYLVASGVSLVRGVLFSQVLSNENGADLVVVSALQQVDAAGACAGAEFEDSAGACPCGLAHRNRTGFHGWRRMPLEPLRRAAPEPNWLSASLRVPRCAPSSLRALLRPQTIRPDRRLRAQAIRRAVRVCAGSDSHRAAYRIADRRPPRPPGRHLRACKTFFVCRQLVAAGLEVSNREAALRVADDHSIRIFSDAMHRDLHLRHYQAA